MGMILKSAKIGIPISPTKRIIKINGFLNGRLPLEGLLAVARQKHEETSSVYF
jgi:hypothetical protein